MCDVCGIHIDAERAVVHAGWHRAQDERFATVVRALDTLTELVRNQRT